MKYEWRKQARDLYLPPNRPERVTVPLMKFFMLEGRGNPNGPEFGAAVEVLYSLAYGVKMLPKKGIVPEGYFEYAVFPLEGVWDLAEEAKELDKLDKDSLCYTMMIRQPDFVSEEIARMAIDSVNRKKPHPLIERVRFGAMEEGKCIQMMHLGSFDAEPESFARMEAYCQTENLRRKSMTHREIYLSDARKTKPDQLKTVLRFAVEQLPR